VVSGRDFASTDSSDIVMDSPDTEELEVRVKRIGERGTDSAHPVVTVADFKVPIAAMREFRKANEAMAKQDWMKAIQRLQRAVAIYPSYAAAYNNLGVAYARIGDRAKERVALENAISINDHLAPVYVNLARMDIATQNFAEAETALNKATDLDPGDGGALVMLVNVEMMNHHYDEAIATSRKVHAMVQSQHSTVHWVAAHAFEQKKQYDAAIAELVLFLSEEKSGARADQVRKELAEVQSAPREAIGN
jgi:tetratricopeptide (TPR) repeat protein